MKAVRNLLIMALVMVFASIPLGIAPAFAEGDVVIDATNFPDEVFREYVKGFDKDHNGTLSQNELDAVTEIDVIGKEIHDLTGVAHFKKLAHLICYNNKLTALDVSQNTALKELNCGVNRLTSLDVSQNTALIELDCGVNQLTSLDVSQNTALKFLYCSRNQLTALDVTLNEDLKELDCSVNPLGSVNVSQNPALRTLYCINNQLTALDVSQNPALEYLYCGRNQLGSLNLLDNSALKMLDCMHNQLTALDLSNNTSLKVLNCGVNQLTSLDVSKHTALTELICGVNQLTSLDLSKNTALTALNCSANQLAWLDLSKNTGIKDEDFDGSAQEYAIDVNQNTLKFDLASFPEGFDPAKASEWVGGSFSGTTLTIDSEKPATVTYRYEAREGKFLNVTLNITYKDMPTAIVSFDSGGGSGTMADEAVNKGSVYTLPECTFTAPANKKFKGWAVGSEGKAAGETITVNDNTTVRAMWGSLEGGEAKSEYKPVPSTPEKVAEKIKVRLTIGSNLLVQEINGVKKDIKMDIVPYIKEGRTMLPIRFIAEGLGLEVEWLDDTRTVTLKDEDYSAEIPVDTDMIRVGGKAIKSDVKPEIKEGRTMLPLRHVAEALGFDVEWTESTETVTISKA